MAPQTRETLCASRVETPSASRSAAGGGFGTGKDIPITAGGDYTQNGMDHTQSSPKGYMAGGDTPTPLVDAKCFDAEIWEDPRASDRIVVDSVVKADFARDLERVARRMAKEAEAYIGIGFDLSNESERLKNALAAWRELEERK